MYANQVKVRLLRSGQRLDKSMTGVIVIKA